MFVEQTWPGTDVTISVFAFLQILMMEGDSLFDLKVQLWPIIYAFLFVFWAHSLVVIPHTEQKNIFYWLLRILLK